MCLVCFSCVSLAQGVSYSVRVRQVSANGGLWSEETTFDTPRSANNESSSNSRSLNSSINYGATASSVSMHTSTNYGTWMMHTSMSNDRCVSVSCLAEM